MFRKIKEFVAFGTTRKGRFYPFSIRRIKNRMVKFMLYPSSAMLYNLYSYDDTDHNRIIGIGGRKYYADLTWRPSGEVGNKHGNKVSLYLETQRESLYITDIQVNKPVKVTLMKILDGVSVSIKKGHRLISVSAVNEGLKCGFWRWPKLADSHKGKCIMLGMKILA